MSNHLSNGFYDELARLGFDKFAAPKERNWDKNPTQRQYNIRKGKNTLGTFGKGVAARFGGKANAGGRTTDPKALANIRANAAASLRKKQGTKPSNVANAGGRTTDPKALANIRAGAAASLRKKRDAGEANAGIASLRKDNPGLSVKPLKEPKIRMGAKDRTYADYKKQQGSKAVAKAGGGEMTMKPMVMSGPTKWQKKLRAAGAKGSDGRNKLIAQRRSGSTGTSPSPVKPVMGSVTGKLALNKKMPALPGAKRTMVASRGGGRTGPASLGGGAPGSYLE
jgi:hypothetical protein